MFVGSYAKSENESLSDIVLRSKSKNIWKNNNLKKNVESDKGF